MKSQGYRVVYDYPYSHATTLSVMNSNKSQCYDVIPEWYDHYDLSEFII